METIELLRTRCAELVDMQALEMLSRWDQQVMMPAGGAPSRAHQLTTLARLTHELATDEAIGGWLQELEDASLDELDADVVRIARRDWERARRVPAELAAARSGAEAEAHELWVKARAEDDFASFAPALERNVELARDYGDCVAEPGQTRYEALIADFDFGLGATWLSELFGRLADELAPLAEEASVRTPARALQVPVAIQQAAVESTLGRLGVEPGSWRVDVSAHPFTSSMGEYDSRITTRYGDGNVESLLSSLHEYGHALYERQIDPALTRTSLAGGTSMSIHESQSKLWENHVARSPAFAEILCAELERAGFEIAPPDLHASLVGVERSLVRVSADPLTFPLHIILRFELEVALIAGDLSARDLPEAWNDGMRRLLGVEVPSDALGCLQDVHWAAGAFGYFPSYALGCLIAAQLWETLERDLGPRDDSLRGGEVGEIQDWLRERVHRHGRRLDTIPLLERATGRGLEVEPFLRYVAPLAGR